MTSQDPSLYTKTQHKYINDKGKPVTLYLDRITLRKVIRQKQGDKFRFVFVEDYNKNRIPSIYIKTNKTRGKGTFVYSSYAGNYYTMSTTSSDKYHVFKEVDYTMLMYNKHLDDDSVYETALNELKIVIHRIKNKNHKLKLFHLQYDGDENTQVEKIALGKKRKDGKQRVIIHYAGDKKRYCDISRTCIIQHKKTKTIYICEASPKDMNQHLDDVITKYFP